MSIASEESAYERGLRDAIHKNIQLKDFLIAAFIAEVGCLPSECALVEQRQADRVIWTIEEYRKDDHSIAGN